MIKVSPVVRQELVFSKKNENPLDYISISDYIMTNKTCQGYARKCTLKPAGFSFLEAVIKQARSFSGLFDLRILMPRHGNSKSFPAVSMRGVWQITSVADHTRSRRKIT